MIRLQKRLQSRGVNKPPVLLAPNDKPDLSKLTYPLMVSNKYDGWRCIITPDGAYTRSWGEIPNKWFQRQIAPIVTWCATHQEVFDCEVMHPSGFGSVSKLLRSHSGVPDEGIRIDLCVIDSMPVAEFIDPTTVQPFKQRYVETALKTIELCTLKTDLEIFLIRQTTLHDPDKILEMYAAALNNGHEGLILRSPTGKYKHGRATMGEGIIYKMKPEATMDVQIIGINARREMLPCASAARTLDKFGKKKRTHKAEDYVSTPVVGSFWVKDATGMDFGVGFGTGFTMADRAAMYAKKDDLVGRWIEIKYMDYGLKDAPRHGRLVRFREDLDE